MLGYSQDGYVLLELEVESRGLGLISSVEGDKITKHSGYCYKRFRGS